MPQGDDRVVAYLRDARRDELALARTLRAQVASSPRNSYRDGLERYLDETRGHARRLERRLRELGAGDGAPRRALRALGEAGAGIRAWARLPLRGMSGGRRALSGAQYGCATEGLVIATYTALEVIATKGGDGETARLAAEIRAEEQLMLEWLRHEIVKLTDPFLREELDSVDPQVSISEVRRALARSDRV